MSFLERFAQGAANGPFQGALLGQLLGAAAPQQPQGQPAPASPGMVNAPDQTGQTAGHPNPYGLMTGRQY